MKYAFAALMLLAGSSANASKFAMDFAPTQNQQHRMLNGVAAIESAGIVSKVRIIAPEEPVKKRGVVQLVVFNSSGNAFDVGCENISAVLDDGSPVLIVTPQRLVKEEKNRRMWRGIAAGLSAAGNSMNASNAGYSHGYGSFRGTTNSAYGTSFTSGTTSYSSYNNADAAVAQSLANMSNQQTFDRLSMVNDVGKAGLRENFQTTTMDPGAFGGGLVTFELPDAVRKAKQPVAITFHIKSGSDDHAIRAMFNPS